MVEVNLSGFLFYFYLHLLCLSEEGLLPSPLTVSFFTEYLVACKEDPPINLEATGFLIYLSKKIRY
jgi:hypothetical protein